MNDAQQIAEIKRLVGEVARVSTRVATLEQQGAVVDQIKRLVELLEPVSTHAKNILAVQSGAMGVRQ